MSNLIDLAPFILHAGLTAGLAFACVSTDARTKRLRRLLVNGKPIEPSSIVTVGRWSNARVGLLNHSGLAPGQGLCFPCKSAIHMKGMLFAIDVVFLDAQGRVLDVKRAEPDAPRVAAPRGARTALEVGAGYASQELGLVAGDVVTLF